MTQPASPLATSPIAVGKTNAAAGASDIASGPRANAPPPDLKGNARAAARRAGEAARNGASVADAIAQAKAPKTSEAAPSPEGVPSAPVEDSTSTPAGGSEEAGQPPAEETSSEIDVRTRVRQREQRMQRELAEREQRIAAREAEIQQRESQSRQILDRHAQLEQLRKTDVAKWAQEIGLDEATLKPIVMGRIAAGKPEGQVMSLEQKVAAIEERDRQREQQAREQVMREQRASSEQAFVKLATDTAKYPTVAAVYADDHGELVRDAWAIQNRFAQQFRRNPTQEEIAVNLERMQKERVQRASKLLGSTPAPATPPPAPKPRVPSPSEQTRTAPAQRTERIETDRERRERAAREAKKAIAASNKRNVSQAR